jgi:hypothetical protein
MSAITWSLPLGARVESREPWSEVRIDTSVSGKEARSTWWSAPRYRWKIVVESLRSDAGSRLDWQATWGHFARHFGQLDSFFFQDPDDNAVLTHPFGLGNGTTTAFQLQRSQVAGVLTSSALWPSFADGFEPVWSPVTAGLLIYKNSILQTLTTNYTVSATGLVTFVAAPAAAAPLQWSGSYVWRVRLDGSIVHRRMGVGLYSTEINLVSVK